jgi:hypothetical protein
VEEISEGSVKEEQLALDSSFMSENFAELKEKVSIKEEKLALADANPYKKEIIAEAEEISEGSVKDDSENASS